MNWAPKVLLAVAAAAALPGRAPVAAPVAAEPGGDAAAVEIDRPYGHAHNDYYHESPLWTSLGAGMLSIEADVFRQGEELFVAHETSEIEAARTLRTLYLEPLAEHFRDVPVARRALQPTLILLVDFKSEGAPTWRLLERQLAEFPDLFTTIESGGRGAATVRPGPVTVVVSGKRPIELISRAATRRSAIDGRYPEDERSDAPTHLLPMISASLRTVADNARRHGRTLGEEFARFSDSARRAGRIARVWGTPDTVESWAKQVEAGLLLINTDRPVELADWLNRIDDRAERR